MIERLREDLLRNKGVEGLKMLDFLGYTIGRELNECQSSTSDELIKGTRKKVLLSKNGLRLTIKSEETPIIIGIFLTRALLDNLGICTVSDLERFFAPPPIQKKSEWELSFIFIMSRESIVKGIIEKTYLSVLV